MTDSEDHREKNILLAKNLNEVKMDLRVKKKDLMAVKSQLRLEKQRNSKLATEQITILNQINGLKKELEETFLKNTFGYLHLSKQLDQMHEFSMQKVSETSALGSTIHLSVTNQCNSSESSLLAKLKTFTESFMSSNANMSQSTTSNTSVLSNTSMIDFEGSFSQSMTQSTSTSARLSLSFNSFEMGLNSTFVKDSEHDEQAESELNQTFLCDDTDGDEFDENKTPPAANPSYITVRKSKKMAKGDQSKMKSRINKNQAQKENQSTNTDLLNTPNVVLRRGRRDVKRIDYNERSFRRNKQ